MLELTISEIHMLRSQCSKHSITKKYSRTLSRLKISIIQIKVILFSMQSLQYKANGCYCDEI